MARITECLRYWVPMCAHARSTKADAAEESTSRRTPSPSWPPRGGSRLATGASLLSLLVLLMAAVGADALRVQFFADDFHFLDVARRIPVIRLLSGQYGMWPWYRPLSRELYFRLVVSGGPAALGLARALSLACLFGSSWLLWRVGRRLVGGAAAALAVALFLSYAFTKFLVAWASGFQDLLALLLTLAALEAHLRDRHPQALLWAFLAPLAKETGFLVFPLLVACAFVCPARRPGRAWIARLAAACGAAAVVHVAARLTWWETGWSPRTVIEPERLPAILGQALGGFVSQRPVPGARALALALTAGASAASWLILAAPTAGAQARHGPDAPLPRGPALVWMAAALGLTPVVVAHLLNVTYTQAYQLFPAVPWVALLLARPVARLPDPVPRVLVPLLVAWNVWGLGFRPPDLERSENWRIDRLDWHDAMRFSAVSRRLGEDVREQLLHRPDSAIVLYEGMPPGCCFQTEDGPATREALGDPRVRAYWVNDPPMEVTRERLVILTFDIERLHLQRARWSNAVAVQRAMRAIMAGRGRAAKAFALYGGSPDSGRFDRAYLRSGAALLEQGPGAFVRGLAAAGLADTLGETPAALAKPLAVMDPALGMALAGVLRHPLSAMAHVALADSLLARGVAPRAGLELRIAVTLDPARLHDRYRLAWVMASLGGSIEAIAELRRIVADPRAGSLGDEARAAIVRMEREGAGTRR